MRWIVAFGYAIAILWFLFSLITFLYNYAELRRLEAEMGRIRAAITVYKTDMVLLKKGVSREVKDSSRAVRHDDEGGSPKKGRK